MFARLQRQCVPEMILLLQIRCLRAVTAAASETFAHLQSQCVPGGVAGSGWACAYLPWTIFPSWTRPRIAVPSWSVTRAVVLLPCASVTPNS